MGKKTRGLILGLFFIQSIIFGENLIPNFSDNKLRAAARYVDITPQYFETFTDLNNNGKFDGYVRKPQGEIDKGVEPFEDKNGNGIFDAVWIAGFGPGRAAQGVNDPIGVRCLIISKDNEYVVFIVFDFVGLLKNRVEIIKDKLEEIGIDRNKVIISCTHNHQGPDTIGLWGPKMGKSGINKEYLNWVEDKVVELVRNTSLNLKTAKVKFGQIRMRDISPYYNGKNFGGKASKNEQLGLIYDGRDPIIVDDLFLSMKFDDEKGKSIAIFINWSGHPEVLGASNNYLSSDYVHYTREKIEKDVGGVTVFSVGAVGGMISSLGADVPIKIGKNPTWAKKDTFEFAKTLGRIIADAVRLSLKNSRYEKIDILKILSQEVKLPVENKFYYLASSMGVFEIKIEELPQDEQGMSLISSNIYYVKFGNAEIVTVPGEILPELVDGIPDDPTFFSPRPNKYFPQHQINDKLKTHIEPFIPEEKSIRKMMKGKYKIIVGLADNMIGYIIPKNDFNLEASPLGYQGDHYEETNSLGPETAPILIKAIEGLLQEAYNISALPYGDKSPHSSIFFVITPTISSVKITPKKPTLKDTIKISARIFNDEKLTDISLTMEAKIFYSIDDGRTYQEVNMVQNKKRWEGKIPPQKSGQEIIFYLWAKDNVGNVAVEIPRKVSSFPPKDVEMSASLVEEEEVEGWVPPDLDIKELRVGCDEENIYLKLKVQGEIKKITRNGIACAYLIPVLNMDISPDNLLQANAVVYSLALPSLLGIEAAGVYNLQKLMTLEEKKSEGKVEIHRDRKNEPSIIYFKVERGAFGENKSGSFKLGAATLGIANMTSPETAPRDATGYILVYFRKNRVKVR